MLIRKIVDEQQIKNAKFEDAVFDIYILGGCDGEGESLNIQVSQHQEIGSFLYKQGDVVYHVQKVPSWRDFDKELASLLLSGLSLEEAMGYMMV